MRVPVGMGKPAGDASLTTNVNHAEPALPRPTRSERQAKIDEQTEANAKRRVLEWENKYRMHTVAKHGPEIPDIAMRQRAIDGTNPTTGRGGVISSSSKFTSWKLQMHTINKALYKMRGKQPSPTGFDSEGNPVVKMEISGAGHGYKPNKNDRQNPRRFENLNNAEVRFDKNNPTRPFTAFPY